MLFSLAPKLRKNDLFDRDQELSTLRNSLQIYPLTLITGLRRVGKSSLISVFLNESDLIHITIDGRKVYQGTSGNISHFDLVRELNTAFSKISNVQRMGNFLRRVKGINVLGNAIEMNPKEVTLPDLFEKFNELAKAEDNFFVLCFDEAQYFRFYGSRGGNDLLAFLSYVYDNLTNVRIIVTGSEIGVLHDFLKLKDYNSPLYGRAIQPIVVKPFSFEQSVEFLQTGFREIGEEIGFDISEVVEKMDGIPGYLTLFGVKYLETKDKETALREVYSLMEGLFKKEMNELEKRSPRYMTILQLVAQGVNTWTMLKNYFLAKGDMISDSRLSELLRTLEKMSLIEKTQSGYRILDPVFEKILKGQSPL
mgnify:FL=1